MEGEGDLRRAARVAVIEVLDVDVDLDLDPTLECARTSLVGEEGR
jgi:hypothetical protein